MADTADAILTALALVEARLDGRDGNLRFLLGGADLRPACAVLASMLASFLRGEFGDDAGEAVARLRPVLLGDDPP
jgi:hypothetical protein